MFGLFGDKCQKFCNDQNRNTVLLKVASVLPDLPSDPFGLEVHLVPAELTQGLLQETNSIASQKRKRIVFLPYCPFLPERHSRLSPPERHHTKLVP